MPDADDPDESWIIRTFDAGTTRSPHVRVSIGDDTAVFDDGRLVTVDTLVEGVHWDSRLSPEDVGWKLVAVNVSDVAAMGGRPEHAVLALSLPSPLDRPWVTAFARGFQAACARWGVVLIGGDTTRAPVRMASLTLEGHANRPVLRSGGSPGDDIWVTGTLGLAAEGFLAADPRPEAMCRLRRPEPRLAFAVAIADAGLPTAMMDLSDGLYLDLGRLCAASSVGASVDATTIPGDAPLAWRTSFGEDYELLFTAPPAHRDALRSVATMHDTPIRMVGTLEKAPGLRLRGADSWPAPLFAHFAPGSALNSPAPEAS